MVRLALRTLHREVFDASSAMTLYGMNLWLPNEFYPAANEWQNDPQAALQRHQQRVASYQYVLTRFPAQQKGNLNKRLLTCSHVMMSNEHKKHSLDALGLVLGISYAVAPKLASLMGKATPTQSASIAYSPLIRCQTLTNLVMMFLVLQAPTTTAGFLLPKCPRFPPSFSPPTDAIRHSPPLTSSPYQPRHTRTRVVRRPDRLLLLSELFKPLLGRTRPRGRC